MSAPVFYDADLSTASPNSVIGLAGAEARHAVAVRRIEVGEVVHICNGRGLRAVGRVVTVEKSPARLGIEVESVSHEAEPDVRLMLVQALAKSGRDESAVEMACEVGVDAIIPWQAERSIVQWKGAKGAQRQQRWQTIAWNAAKQSRRAWVPEVQTLATLAALTSRIESGGTWLVAHESASIPIGQIDLPLHGDIGVIVGPEGGISPAELEALAAAGAHIVRLGPHVMRTSSAGPVAIAYLASRLGRWT